MMWAEALVSSSLLLLAVSFALNSAPPQAGSHFLDFYQYSELSDAASISMEKNLSAQGCVNLFSQSQNSCYSCAWFGSQAGSLPPEQIFYSSEDCKASQNQKISELSVSRGAWREGRVQFLSISKFKK